MQDKNIENIICIEKNYKENVENISMNTSGKIKKRENISWIDTFPLLPLKTEQRPKMWKT